jgi:hypothetical protein
LRGQGLVGLGFLGSDTTASVFSIDSATGNATRILSTPAVGVTGVPIGFDASTRRLFFEDGVALYTADLAHRTVSRVPINYCCPSLFFATLSTAPSLPLLSPIAGLALFVSVALVGWRLAHGRGA